MGQLAASIHAGVERLITPAVIIAAVSLQESVPAVGKRHRPLATVQLDGFRQALIAKVAQVGIARVGLRTMTLEIAFGHDPKRAHSRERAAVVPVQFVAIVAVEHELSIETARQFEAIDKRIARIEGSVLFSIAITNVVAVVPVALKATRAV
jgi:hypothetical protein